MMTVIVMVIVTVYCKSVNRNSYFGTLYSQPIPVTACSKAWVCGRSLAGIAGSNPASGVDVCLLWLFCSLKWMSLCQADHSSRGVLPTVVCLECDREASIMTRPWSTRGCRVSKKKNEFLNLLSRKWESQYCYLQLNVIRPLRQN
jgi:hypothetical protein